MIIWHNDRPYMINEIEDFDQLLSEEAYQALLTFVKEDVESEKISSLEDEIWDLENEVSNLEDEIGALEDEVYDLKETASDYERLCEELRELIYSLEDVTLSKDAKYYLDQVKTLSKF